MIQLESPFLSPPQNTEYSIQYPVLVKTNNSDHLVLPPALILHRATTTL